MPSHQADPNSSFNSSMSCSWILPVTAALHAIELKGRTSVGGNIMSGQMTGFLLAT